jgi:signal transduction histidine kinase
MVGVETPALVGRHDGRWRSAGDPTSGLLAELPAALDRAIQLCRADWGALLAPGSGAGYTLVAGARLSAELARALTEADLQAISAARPGAPTCVLVGYQLVAVPLRDGGSVLGLLALGFAGQAAAIEQPALLEALADGLAVRLRAQPRQRIARLTSQLGLINRLGQYTSSIHDRRQLFGQITHVIHESLGYDTIQLLLVDQQTGLVELAHASGVAGEPLLRQGFSEPVGGRGIIGWVAGSGQIWISDDVTRDPHYIYHRLMPHTAAEIALPLRVGERIIGVLDVQSERAGEFDADDIFLLQTVADQIAPALEYNRLFAAERQERELATTLRDISRIVCSSLDLAQVLDLILQQIDRVVPHSGTRITLRGEDDLMRVVAAKGYADNVMAMRSVFRAEEAVLTAPVLYEHQTLVVADARTDPRWFWQVGAEQVRSWCCAPLVIKDRCIGWLCVDWDEPNFYTEVHARNVRAFADQAAVAIENAQLYAAVKEFNDQLDRKVQRRTGELRQARDQLAAKAEQLSALLRRVVHVQEAERQRIAHDLHDGVTQSILAAIYELHALRRRIGGPDGDADRRIAGSQQLLDSTLHEMKRIIYALRPRALDELGLIAALEHLAAEIRERHGLEVVLEIAGAPSQLADEIELAIYRIVQEATQNSLRHAAASQLRIEVEFAPRLLCVSVGDDGCGIAAERAGGGLGLAGMRERAQALGGRLEIVSEAGAGTRIVFALDG